MRRGVLRTTESAVSWLNPSNAVVPGADGAARKALEQAKQVASAICRRPLPASEVPWFWSVQYDLKLQIADRTPDSDRTVLRGYSRQAKFAVFHLRGKALHAVEAVNAPGEFMGVRQLIGKPLAIDIEALANPMITMKHVAI